MYSETGAQQLTRISENRDHRQCTKYIMDYQAIP